MADGKKPPLGVMPARIWRIKRIQDITRAINEYAESENPSTAIQWCNELKQLLTELAMKES